MKKIIKLIMVVALVIACTFSMAGCIFAGTEESVQLGELSSMSNNVTLKVEQCMAWTFSTPKTDKGKKHILITFSIDNKSGVSLPIVIDENFTAKYDGNTIGEANGIEGFYDNPLNVDRIENNEIVSFEVGYLLPENWVSLDVEYNPSSTIDINLPVAKEYVELTMLSASMMPIFDVGDKVRIKTDAMHSEIFEVGDIIAFYTPNNNIWIHRIVDVSIRNNEIYYTTKGDANLVNDALEVSNEDVIGIYQDEN